jgi:hypothetical protein
MKAEPAAAPENRERMERDALRLLCSVVVKPGTRLEICRLLKPDDFRHPLRRTVFEEILQAGPVPSRQLRALLPARVTSRGFPGFVLDRLLAPKLSRDAKIEQLFESTLQLMRLGGSNFSFFVTPEADAQG